MSDTQLTTVEFRPGINANVTEYRAGDSAGWVDGDKIRFSDGRAQKIGGWSASSLKQFEDNSIDTLQVGAARDIRSWASLQSEQFVSIAGHKKVELVSGNTVYDITPTRKEYILDPGPPTIDDDSRYDTILTNVITTNGTNEVQLTITNHGAEEGDYLYIASQEFAVDGITLFGTYPVLAFVDSDNIIIDAGVAATGSTALAGGKLSLSFLLECGEQSNTNFIGYGGGTWDTPGTITGNFPDGGYGGPRSGAAFGVPLRQWSLDNWGEDLIACVSGGEIYHWDASRTDYKERRLQTLENRIKDPGTLGDPNGFYEPDPVIRQELVDAIPRRNLFCLVALPARIVVAFGSELAVGGEFDPLVIRWSDIESLTDWRVLKTNSAGEYRLPKGNKIVAAYQTRTEIIVFTDEEAYSMAFVGGNDVFRFTPLGTNMSATGIHAVIDVNGIVYWMGVDDFYVYDGTIRPLPNSIDDVLFDQDGKARLDQNQKEKVFAGLNKKFHEIWWFYPIISENLDFATEVDINNYVVYNYLEGVWYYGTMPRSVWVDRGTFRRPFAVGNENLLFNHEQGKDDNGKALPAFIRSGYFDLDEGTDFAFVDRILPDLTLPNNSACKISILTKKYPHPNADIITKGPYVFSDADNKISMRARGRQISIKYEVDGEGQDFEIGKVRIGVQPDGRR